MNKKIVTLLDKIVRVDLAGEEGAKQIYKGQISGSKDDQKAQLEELLSSELVHFEYFQKIGKKLKIRPTFMSVAWKFGSFGIGFLSAKAGNDAKMASTVGVEEVIFDHYISQVKEIEEILSQIDEKNEYFVILTELRKKILRFANEELHHKEVGINSSSSDNFRYKISKAISSKLTKFAIFISEKI